MTSGGESVLIKMMNLVAIGDEWREDVKIRPTASHHGYALPP